MCSNIDFLVECIKNVRDNTQCVTCDKLISPIVRFPCGHSMCQNCAEIAGECLFCISSNIAPVVDEPQTTRVIHTLRLLSAFQETFKIDVEKRQRVSDYLKLEKQIFPECIQAPNKYSNKRKSLDVTSINKENKSPIYLGLKSAKMKKNQYVQNWLNQNEDIPQNLPRKPFGDININTPIKLDRKNGKKPKTKTHINSKKSRYRKPSQGNLRNNSLFLNKIEKPVTKIKDIISINEESKDVEKYEKNNLFHQCDRNESGIVLDDETIFIDDTIIDNVIDKDKEAWLAVLEAAKKDECNETQILSETASQPIEIKTSLEDINNELCLNNTTNTKKDVINTTYLSKNVFFYKKGLLFETCKLCNHDIKNQVNLDSNMSENNDVSIVINNSEFVTTIKFTHCEPNKHTTFHKNSVQIQTDHSETNKHYTNENTNEQKRKSQINDEVTPNKILKPNFGIPSLDVFDSDKQHEYTKEKQICNDDTRKCNVSETQKHLIVEDSDTDSNVSHGNIHEVVAEVHMTVAPETLQPDVLTTLPRSQYQNRSKRTLRGQTPNSSDSSDKENLDPNRIKHPKIGKKLKSKKYSG